MGTSTGICGCVFHPPQIRPPLQHSPVTFTELLLFYSSSTSPFSRLLKKILTNLMTNSPRNVHKTLPSAEEDEPVRLPALENSTLINRFRLTLVGRTFHQGGRNTDAFLALMPSPGIWDLEGRVRGYDLGNGRFHFNFQSEEDLQKVLKKRPCHFNKWTFSLERWELDLQEDLLSFVTFWIKVRGLPLRCWVEEAFQGIGNTLGHVSEVDATDARILVAVDVTKPLKMTKKVILDNEEEVTVSLVYEKLYRYCFTCFMISHEERDCPHLSDRQRQLNKESRAEALLQEGRRSGPYRQKDDGQGNETRFASRIRDRGFEQGTSKNLRNVHNSDRDGENRSNQRAISPPRRQVRRSLYPNKERDRHEDHRQTVWKRMGEDNQQKISRPRETYIQSSYSSRKRRMDLHSEKGTEILKHNHRNNGTTPAIPNRRRDSPLIIGSPTRNDSNLENWRNPRRLPRHDSRTPDANHKSRLNPKEKSKGKSLAIEMEDDDDRDEQGIVPHNFEFGSSSRIEIPPIQDMPALPPSALVLTNPAIAESGTDEYESAFGDIETKETPAPMAVDEELPISRSRIASPISDWEKLAEETSDKERELTEDDILFMKDFEREMILDGLLENDDLLGEDLEIAEEHTKQVSEESTERTITDQVAPITHDPLPLPATSESPTSKKSVSPIRKLTRRSTKTVGTQHIEISPIKAPRKEAPKLKIPKSPNMSFIASRKLKSFHGKYSPKKTSIPVSETIAETGGTLKGKGTTSNNHIPHTEVVTETRIKKKGTKTTKPKEGEEESRISPEPPA